MGIILEPVYSHEYDVDLISAYFKLSQIDFTDEKKLNKQLYLEKIKREGELFCQRNNLYFPFYFNQRLALVIPSTIYNYELYMGLFLMSFEIPKIPAFLSYQKINYAGNKDFVDMVEFLVYNVVRENSPFDNTVRLEKIMEWVTQQRLFVPLSIKKEKSSFPKNGIDEAENIKDSPSTKEYALYHFYKQEAKIVPTFVKTKNSTKRSKMIMQGNEYGVGGNSFANTFYLISHKKNRICDSNLESLNKVIEMLSEFPEAKIKAEKELKEVQQRVV